LFVNLASNEYFSAVDTKELKVAVVPDFKDYKDGKLKIISFYAKRKQGVRYIIDTDAKTINDLQGFNEVINLMRLCQQVIIWCLLGSFSIKEYKKTPM
jgi:cytoplasmic iron level regulating protein YaaA (DUF328/UPF0246 family)